MRTAPCERCPAVLTPHTLAWILERAKKQHVYSESRNANEGRATLAANIETTLAVHHALTGWLSHFSHMPLYFMLLTLACDIGTYGDSQASRHKASATWAQDGVGVVGIYYL